MAKRSDIRKIMVIGSGPIVIGQAAEFDYAGTQACIALKEEGYQVVLLNSNPATIMTDANMADKVYMEPLTLDYVAKIIRKERPDAIIPGLGGQTGLNLVVELSRKGILEECRVEVLGTSLESINNAEDRELFKLFCKEIGEPTIDSFIAHTVEEAILHCHHIGFPLVVRPAFTLAGTGGGFAHDEMAFRTLVESALMASPTHQVLIEKSVYGYKEIEFEVMRDHSNHAIVICDMENIDPVGIHTGDSMVVAPSRTLSPEIFNMLKQSALKMIDKLKIEGGCNVQFALHPTTSKYYLIEVNPRVSRSSALASKATGYPIARMTALIAVGYTLEEIQLNDQNASIPPSVDYTVFKMSRFPFDKFESANRQLSTQMKATGEIMSIGGDFKEALLKGVRSLEIKADHIYLQKFDDVAVETLKQMITKADDERLFAIAACMRKGVDVETISTLTAISTPFLEDIMTIIEFEETLKSHIGDIEYLRKAKVMGFSDAFIGQLWGEDALNIYKLRKNAKITPNYLMVDACCHDKAQFMPYLYSSYSKTSHNKISNRKKIIVIGSGPIRIGQGVEFDYSTVHAVLAIRAEGYEAIVINNNPETVSTDYTISDKLYFEPLTIEDVMSIVDVEQPFGVIVQLGGQTAINLATQLNALGVPIIGTSLKAINLAEDRGHFEKLARQLQVPQPIGEAISDIETGLKVANQIGYPVLVRPSFVLGGRAMQIVYTDKQLTHYLTTAVALDVTQPVLVDKYVIGKEIEVDAICDGDDVFIPGIMEHIERTGVHSGDSISVYPTLSLNEKVKQTIIEYTKRLGLGIGIVGLFNIQFIVDKADQVYVIEVNPRSSRTVPFLSKVTKTPMALIATRVMLGKSLKEQNMKQYINHLQDKRFYVKAPTFSFAKITGVDAILGPEMKSTGEAIGYDETFEKALYKALQAAGMKISNYGTVFLTIADQDKEEVLSIAHRFYELGFNLIGTSGTATFLKGRGLKIKVVDKLSSNSNDIYEWIKSGHVKYIVNTLSVTDDITLSDGYSIRRFAVEHNIPTFTSLDTVKALLDVLETITLKVGTINA